MAKVTAWSARSAKAPLESTEIDLGPLGPDEVEIEVETCGICHSDLSVLDNEWGNSAFPTVAGHEVVGRIVALGERAQEVAAEGGTAHDAVAPGLTIGMRVGVGWNSASCMHCRSCLSGDQHLCPRALATIIGHRGGFAQRMRAHWAWALPIPEQLDARAAGPLLCGGITVFSPLRRFGVRPTDRVGVVGIGGLGHMALMFARAWGCDVTAFTSTPDKFDEARKLGAHHVHSSRDSDTIRSLAGTFDLLLVTVNVPLDWDAFIATLAPRGRLHVVGAVLEPIPVRAFDLIMGERNVSGSPTGSPVDIATMLQFAARHRIAPQVEYFPMHRVNDALEHLRHGKPRYRIVLEADAS